MKIKTEKVNRLGNKLTLPVIGTVDIPKDGIIDLPENQAHEIVQKGIGFDYVDSEDANIKESEEVIDETPEVVEEDKKASEDTEENNEEKPEVVSEETNENPDEDVNLQDMKLKDMKVIAEDAKLPKEEWESISTKKDMIAYLEGKLK